MSLWAIVPVKPLKYAKSRLSPVLLPEQRYRLAEAMFRHVLTVASSVSRVTGVLVISRDTKALAIAREMGAKTLQEGVVSDLNPALLRATMVVETWRADAVLILPADLPFVSADDVRALIDRSVEGALVIASDQYGDGTNALLMRPPGLIPYDYGPGSFQRHIDSARARGVAVRLFHSDRLAMDIDVPQDLRAYHRILGAGQFGHLPAFPDQVMEGLRSRD